MHRTRIVTLLYCLSGIAAALLTWASQTLLGETTFLKGIDPAYAVTKASFGDGWITIGCFIAMMAITATGGRHQLMSRQKMLWTIVFAVISLIISISHAVIIFSLPKATAADDLQMKVAPGVGLYLTILVSLMLVLLPLKHRATVANAQRKA